MRIDLVLAIAFSLLFVAPSARCGNWDPLLADFVFEFHNVILDDYFWAHEAEALAVDQGSAGPGWERTGFVLHLEGAAGNYSFLVARFYGSLSPGPNSHFYTMDQAEIDLLVRLQATTPPTMPRWNLEGGFRAGFVTNGRCKNPVLPQPVYRLYNNGAALGLVPHHRYTVSLSIVNAMEQLGWIPEGVAFCVRAYSGPT